MASNIDDLSGIDRHTFKIGMITRQWAVMEASLDISALILFHDFGGKAIENELPRALARKIAFLRKAISKSPTLVKLHGPVSDLLKCVSEAKQFRHDCVHGISLQEGGQFPFETRTLDRHPESFSERNTKITEKDMDSAIMQAHYLSLACYSLVARLKHERSEPSLSELTPKLLPFLNRPPPSTKIEKRICVAARELLES